MSDLGGSLWVGELELGERLAPVSPVPRAASAYARARILVRLHGEPLGFLEPDLEGGLADPLRLAREAWRRYEEPIRQHLRDDGLALSAPLGPEGLPGRDACLGFGPPAGVAPVTVVVCTRDRPRMLACALERLRALRHDRFEVIVVDSGSSGEATAEAFRAVAGADPRLRYVSEPRPGLSRARNRGLAEAGFEHVAFTDDDVLVDPWWLDGIARGFARAPGAGCVTGLVLPAHLDTAAERYFDRRVWWSSTLEPRVHDPGHPDRESRLFPFDTGRIGTGANFAVDRALMADLGGFDESLGAGSPSRSGEDLDAFLRILWAGRAIVFEPSALVWHHHRQGMAELGDQMHAYGMGLGAYIAKHLGEPGKRGQVLRRAPLGVAHVMGLWARSRPPGEAARTSLALLIKEALGMAQGPPAYWRARLTSGRRIP